MRWQWRSREATVASRDRHRLARATVWLVAGATLATSACSDDGPGVRSVSDISGGYRLEPWSSESFEATSLRFLADGRALVITKGGWFGPGTGVVSLLDQEGDLVRDLLQVPVCTDAERGLLGIEIDERPGEPTYVYLYYTRQMNECVVTHRTEPLVAPVYNRVSRWVLDVDGMDMADEEVVVDDLPGHAGAHNAGDLELLDDGTLLIAVGESGLGPSGDIPLDVANGKVLRVDTRDPSTAPADNPFATSTRGIERYVYGSGFRNPFRLARRESDGVVVVGDVGTDDWEELDILAPGHDYGFPHSEGPAVGDGATGPALAYRHVTGCATVIAGDFVSGSELGLPVEDEVLVFTDFICSKLWAVEVDDDGLFGSIGIRRRWLLAEADAQVADVVASPDGDIYAVPIGPGPSPILRLTSA